MKVDANSIHRELGADGLRRALEHAINPFSDIDGPPPLNGPDDYLGGDSAPCVITPSPFKWCNPASLPRRSWIYGRFLIRRQVSLTVAPGGVGKSSLETIEALSLVTGRRLLHDIPHGQFRVWLWNGEDPRDELDRRNAAACLHYGISAADIGDRLFIDTGRETEIVVARADARNGITVAVPIVDALIEAIRTNRLDVVRIDPFVSCHQVPENDNGAIDRVAKTYARIADQTDCAIHLVHHCRKTGGSAVEIEDGRGAVALIAAARAARTLNSMTEEEASRAGIENRFAHVRIDDGKANLAPRSDKARWIKIVGQSLGNGDGGLLDNSDSVAVVTPWEWPDPLANVTGADFEKAAAAIRAGRWRENMQARNWVGHAVANALGLDLNDKAQKAKVAGMIRIWLAAKSLRLVDGLDEQRKPRRFVEVAEEAE